MKIKFLLPILIAAAGCKGTYEQRESTAATPGAEATPLGSYATPAPGMASDSLLVEVVSVDPSKANVTVRETVAGSPERTLTVEAPATGELNSLKAGDRVRVICQRFQGTTETTGTPPPGTGTTATTAGGLSDCTTIVTITRETPAASR